jgi:hypothetical protein
MELNIAVENSKVWTIGHMSFSRSGLLSIKAQVANLHNNALVET